jgi:HEAT repeat protein
MEQKTRPYLRLLVNHSNREVSAAAEAASVLLKIIPSIPDYHTLMRNGLPEVRIQALSILKALRPPEYQSALKVRLSDSDPRVRRLAAETLAHLGGSEVVYALGVLLNEDGDIEIQKTVAELLGLLHSPQSLGDLTAILEREETDPIVQEAALEALGRLKLPQAFSLFRQFLTHPHPPVAFAAAVGLAQLGRLTGIDLHFRFF